MSAMRIGYITYGLDRSPTGVGRYALELLQALANVPGHEASKLEIVLLTTEQADPFGLWQAFEHHPLRGCRLLPVLTTAGNIALTAAIQRYRLDIVHDPNGIAPFLAPAAGARRVVTIHDAFAYVHPEKHNRLDNWRYRMLLPQATRGADAVITVSQCSRRDLIRALRLPPDRVWVTSEGVNARFHPVPAGPERQATLSRYDIEPPYVLYVGGINARKNLSRLLEAYSCMMQAWPAGGRPKPRLVIAGKRQWRTEEIEATFQRLRLGEHVRFTGYVDDADLPALYSAAELLAFPSLYEGFGLPVLEAMASGTPVVTSNVSSLPEAAGDAAVMVDPSDVDGLSTAMRQVLLDGALREELVARGLVHAARFTWDRVARETLQVYQDVQARPLFPAREAAPVHADDTLSEGIASKGLVSEVGPAK